MREVFISIVMAIFLVGCTEPAPEFEYAKTRYLNANEIAVLQVYINRTGDTHLNSLKSTLKYVKKVRSRDGDSQYPFTVIPANGFFCDAGVLTGSDVRKLSPVFFEVFEEIMGYSFDKACTGNPLGKVVISETTTEVVPEPEKPVMELLDIEELGEVIEQSKTCSPARNFISEKYSSGEMLTSVDLKAIKQRINFCQQVELMKVVKE